AGTEQAVRSHPVERVHATLLAVVEAEEGPPRHTGRLEDILDGRRLHADRCEGEGGSGKDPRARRRITELDAAHSSFRSRTLLVSYPESIPWNGPSLNALTIHLIGVYSMYTVSRMRTLLVCSLFA